MKNPRRLKIIPLLAAGLLLLALTGLYAAQTCPAERPNRGAMGVVQSVDAKTQTLTILPGGPGIGGPRHRGLQSQSETPAPQPREPLVISASGAKIHAVVEGSLADCKVGKWVRVMSRPAREGEEGSVDLITVLAEAPPAFQKPDGAGLGPGPAAGGRKMGPGAKGRGPRGGLAGEIVRLNPLTIKVKDGEETQLAVSDQTRFMKTVAATFADIKEGKRVMVMGDKQENGALAATRIMLQPEKAMGMKGGFGPGRGKGTPPPPNE